MYIKIYRYIGIHKLPIYIYIYTHTYICMYMCSCSYHVLKRPIKINKKETKENDEKLIKRTTNKKKQKNKYKYNHNNNSDNRPMRPAPPTTATFSAYHQFVIT